MYYLSLFTDRLTLHIYCILRALRSCACSSLHITSRASRRFQSTTSNGSSTLNPITGTTVPTGATGASSSTKPSTSTKPQALVLGALGSLGQVICTKFAKEGWEVTKIDAGVHYDETPGSPLLLGHKDSLSVNLPKVSTALKGKSYDAIITVAGGWAGGSLRDKNVGVSIELMNSMNTNSAVVAAHLATRCLSPNGLVVLTGSVTALNGNCADMIGYSLSKAATHHIAKVLSEPHVLPNNCVAVAILPSTLGE
jgi:dihydropteridine reductase